MWFKIVPQSYGDRLSVPKRHENAGLKRAQHHICLAVITLRNVQ